MTDPTLTVTIWPRLTAPDKGKLTTLTWAALGARLRDPNPAGRERKLWAFATFRDNRRSGETHELSHALHLDFDCDPDLPSGDPKRGNPDLSAADLQRVLDGVRHLAHTTKSHAPGAARWRVIIPLSRSVEGDDYRALARVAVERFRRAGVAGLEADPTWNQPERFFYVPEAGTSYESYATPRDVPTLDVDGWLAEAEEIDAAESAHEWPEPLPLSPEYCREVFPVGALPGELATVAEELARCLQVPADVPACIMLGLLSGAVSGKAVAVRHASHSEPLVLWVCAVMRPGGRKSGVVGFLREPLDHAQAVAIAQFASARAAAEARESTEIDMEVKGKKGPVKEKKKPEARPPTLSTSDATPEALSVLMAANGGRMLLAAAEGVPFQHMTGLYQKGAANLDIFLNGWGGEAYSSHRITRAPVYIPRALLAVALTVQPGMLADVSEKRELAIRGVLQRVLWSVPPDLVGHRDVDTAEVPDAVRAHWAATLGGLLDIPVPGSPARVPLDADARAVYVRYAQEVEDGLREGEALDRGDVAREWFSKAPGTAIRVAAILVLAGAPRGGSWIVDGAAMERGVRIMRYFGVHALHALAEAAPSVPMRVARRLHSWLARIPGIVALTLRDAHLQVNQRGIDAKVIGEALTVLAEANVIRRAEETPSRGPGRPSSPGWIVNPRWKRSR